jgi:hypothetical protein
VQRREIELRAEAARRTVRGGAPGTGTPPSVAAPPAN